MQPTPEKQHIENRKNHERKLSRKLGVNRVDAEKFADMRPTLMNRPAGHTPGKGIYDVGGVGKPRHRVGIQVRGVVNRKTKGQGKRGT